ncbi:cytochrome c oxidase assembly protein COX16-domain-containing protein [Trametes polyzona]|nr:cytochrome c oxidase assembly protein COX16-domain-containing protein [Trametes polyzona]
MPTFSSNPLNAPAYSRVFRKYPALFGVPFVLLIVGASFGLQQSTQMRYELHDQKVTVVSPLKEQELGLAENRRKIDIRGGILRAAAAAEDWEPKQIERPKGLPEWGVPPSPTCP